MFHHILTVSLHYLIKYKFSKIAETFTKVICLNLFHVKLLQRVVQ